MLIYLCDGIEQTRFQKYMYQDNITIKEFLQSLIEPIVKSAVSEVLAEGHAEEVKAYPKLVTVAQASEITAYSKNSIYQMHSNGTIPGAKKVGAKLLFDRDVLLEWVNNGGRV